MRPRLPRPPRTPPPPVIRRRRVRVPLDPRLASLADEFRATQVTQYRPWYRRHWVILPALLLGWCAVCTGVTAAWVLLLPNSILANIGAVGTLMTLLGVLLVVAART